ncbi:hypothetical protein [Pyrodictium abyssi]|uniref:Ribbon-helix-helix protein CopG domain-containing protein n=1 Tax=Pyrodictium abyssi TaxID=54256 RepID=A0ABN6ZSP5_9CREN|nr:hypothetical protein PABY_11450 [Pyrodictium abyssi]
MAKVLVAVALSDEEAEALERAARREGHGDLGRVLEKALRLYLETGGASISSRALYSSQQAGRIRGTVCP